MMSAFDVLLDAPNDLMTPVVCKTQVILIFSPSYICVKWLKHLNLLTTCIEIDFKIHVQFNLRMEPSGLFKQQNTACSH